MPPLMPERLSTTLPCGMQVVAERTPSRAVYCGIVVKAGTRHEEQADTGMAHFVEHMTFKGTRRRTARQINGLLERRGGDIGAFTSKQETVYYAQVMPEDFALAADLLCDMVFCSTYPQAEIDKEAEVICDEIESYRDAPAELIFDDFESRLFPGSPLGRDVLGDADRLRSYTAADALRFVRRYYTPANCVFYACGDITASHVVRALTAATRMLSPVAVEKAEPPVVPAAPFMHRAEKGTHQAHVVVGAPVFGGNDARHTTLQLLNNLLGGPATNSRLNLALRERAGLVYTVDSYASCYPDIGLWVVYFGCDAHDTERCLRLVRRELARLADSPLPLRTLQAAQRQLVRQTRLACDNYESYALAFGKAFAHYGRHRDIARFCTEVEAVTPESLHAVAAEFLAPSRLSTLIYA